jgi:glucose-1-phosphate thymidylyltransferase
VADIVTAIRGHKLRASGELEITDVNRIYLERGELNVSVIGRGTTWLDGGTRVAVRNLNSFASLSNVRASRSRASRRSTIAPGPIDMTQLAKLADRMKPCSYPDYLLQIAQQETVPFSTYQSS